MPDILQPLVQFANDQPLISLAIIAVLAALSWKKPKKMFNMLLIVAVFAALYGIVSLLGTATITGIDNKTEMVEKNP